MSTVQDVIAKVRSAQDAFRKAGADAVTLALKAVFDEVPELVVIKWNQYTPYFNDGDECVFRVGEPQFAGLEEGVTMTDEEILEAASDTSSYEIDHDNLRPLIGYGAKTGLLTKEKAELLEEVSGALQTTLEDALKSVFGDHAQITVTRQGVTVSEFNHD